MSNQTPSSGATQGGPSSTEPGNLASGPALGAFAALALITLASVGVISHYALLTVLLDGGAALAVVAPAALSGLWLVPWRAGSGLPLRWHLLLGAALGIGLLSLLTLGLGVIGVLEREVWILLTILLSVAGLLRLWLLLRAPRASARADTADANTHSPRFNLAPDPPVRPALNYAWLITAPFLVIALLTAAHAPGLLWQEEGYGYDVLEYHLQTPKEYCQAGQINYLPHNVYANFPAQVEMLYLLDMVLSGEDIEAGVTAQLIHTILALLAVYAAWVAGREWSRSAGMLCALVLATVGWLPYLCGLAYVENGLLFFSMTGFALVARASRQQSSPQDDDNAGLQPRAYWRLVLLAGICAGFACGCKYTAVSLTVLPLALVLLVGSRRAPAQRVAGVFLFLLGGTVAFSPWLIKNQVLTGNPVFPLANSVFKAEPPGWGAEQTERWDAGHRPKPEENTVGARLGSLWSKIAGDCYQRFGPVVLTLGLLGLYGRKRTRLDGALVLAVLAQLGAWLLFTHLYARFAVVLLVPLCLLAGRALTGTTQPRRFKAVAALVVLGAGFNFLFLASLYRSEALGAAPAEVIYQGELPGFEFMQVVNEQLPTDAHTLLIGEARAFYFQRRVDYYTVFNQQPLVELLRRSPTEEKVLDWLRGRGYTHVLVNWLEVDRLARTYGFAPEINRALFERLQAAGLHRVYASSLPSQPGPYVEIFEL